MRSQTKHLYFCPINFVLDRIQTNTTSGAKTMAISAIATSLQLFGRRKHMRNSARSCKMVSLTSMLISSFSLCKAVLSHEWSRVNSLRKEYNLV